MKPGPRWALLAWIAGGQALFAQVAPDPAEEEAPGITIEMLDQMSRLPGGLGPLPPVSIPLDNPQSVGKIELGRKLFFDRRLSLDRMQSCASCHDPRKGFSDGRSRSVGRGGKRLARHSPSVLNAAYNSRQFWDGRAASLEDQAEGPMLAASEMGMGSARRLVARLQGIPEYIRQFQAVFGGRPTLQNATRGIAAFERTLVTPDSPFDAYARGDKRALSDSEKRGLILFIGKASCVQCHKGPGFMDDRFHRLGVRKNAMGARDLGRFAVTGRKEDRRAFKTPTLLNVSLTAPYTHDGTFKTLEQVIDFYDRGGDKDVEKSPLIFELGLSTGEKADLLAFLLSLTGRPPVVSAPPISAESRASQRTRASR